MRSRYCAFALHISQYIIDTTHPDNQDFTLNTTAWLASIEAFCQSVSFDGLEILEFVDGANEAFVQFKATLGEIHMTEKSRFLLRENKWLYESGEFE